MNERWRAAAGILLVAGLLSLAVGGIGILTTTALTAEISVWGRVVIVGLGCLIVVAVLVAIDSYLWGKE